MLGSVDLILQLIIREVEVVQLEILEDKHVDSLSEALSSDEDGEMPCKALKRESDNAVEEPANSRSWCSIS